MNLGSTRMRMEDKPPDGPGIIAPPPLIYFGMLALGVLIERVFPLDFLPDGVTSILGGVLVAVGVGIVFFAIRAMRRAGTPVDPYKPTTALVIDGPFRFTRNPLYLSLTLVYLGITSLMNAFWPLMLLPAALVIMQRGVIIPEERYLESKFGEEYLRYKAKVRRWL
jgi:protein-S-isoprenylcysteine O-methyltransferase Ste14